MIIINNFCQSGVNIPITAANPGALKMNTSPYNSEKHGLVMNSDTTTR